MIQATNCPSCGNDFLPTAKLKGQCPNCLVERMQSIVLGSSRVSGIDGDVPGKRFEFQPPPVEELANQFPQLEVLELIGHGGMGAVYKARQTKLDRIVALKILPREIDELPGFSQRFEREAKVLAKLSHANIVTVHDFGKAGDWYFFVMEYVDGTNLRKLLKEKRLRSPEVMAIIPKICEAIQYAHEQGIVHRDIKPENILIDQRGNVKIADFGLAKLLDFAPGVEFLTRTQQVMGTVHYMAPEQMEQSTEVDHRADIYSLGVVFYEMLTGELPLGQFEPPSSKIEIDVRIDGVVLRALAKEPNRRYQRVNEMQSDFERFSLPGVAAPKRFGMLSDTNWAQFALSATKNLAQFALIMAVLYSFMMFVMSLEILSNWPHANRIYVVTRGMASLLFSFVMARILISPAKSWQDLRALQILVLPPLIVGYLGLVAVICLWPLLALTSVAAIPEFAKPGSVITDPFTGLTHAVKRAEPAAAVETNTATYPTGHDQETNTATYSTFHGQEEKKTDDKQQQPTTWTMFGESYTDDAGRPAARYWLKVFGWGGLASGLWLLAAVFTRQHWLPKIVPLFHPATPLEIQAVFGYVAIFVGLLVFPIALILLVAHN